MGEITSDKQWQVLSKLKNGYQDSLFTSVAVAQNVAKPLVKYIDNALVGEGGQQGESHAAGGARLEYRLAADGPGL